MRSGTLAAILVAVAETHGMTRDAVQQQIKSPCLPYSTGNTARAALFDPDV